ncbi:nuclear transport factor 2 family protein [Actinomadura fulvescens]|uniref:Nuclear transport factor 2 family protein n=2 Tax=Actinomadura fulvescens TaxID=46160 RepID=A0ABN3Q3P2_9ACTN
MMAEHPNATMLRAVYADLSTIGRYLDDDVVLHAAERSIAGMTATHHGRQAVLDKELALIRATEGTLVMDVEQVCANDHFGAVTGRLRAHRQGRRIAMPFCGLWRFRDGRILEHWENAYDAAALGAFLSGDLDAASPWLTADAQAGE